MKRDSEENGITNCAKPFVLANSLIYYVCAGRFNSLSWHLLNISLLKAHARLVGNRHTGDCAASCSSWYLANIVCSTDDPALQSFLFLLKCSLV